uniref:Uncharacterized protein n=1 Tax=Arundo donax TaxID=35708 RepID=A0A0A8YKP5_ARUDO
MHPSSLHPCYGPNTTLPASYSTKCLTKKETFLASVEHHFVTY